ncbi:unnamed protein product [Rotaria sordida]|uniref:Uncharacterized protein n=1 Tax=Rotaria sordida TaxID=392033 RepID=A0A819MWM7_9BILA|nr:unnamed protein product [Rotaria sordida]
MRCNNKKLNESELWPLTTTNNHPNCRIDDQDMNSSDVEQKSNDKKRQKKNKPTIIDTDLLIDRYHLTEKVNREYFYSSEDEDQPQSPYSPDKIWREEKEDDEEEEDL